MAVELGEGQSAEPGKCGSCDFFRHRQEKYDTCGICSVKLPPWVRKRGDEPKDDSEVDPRTVSDTDGCSLYRPRGLLGDPVQFIQKRIWNAGNPSR